MEPAAKSIAEGLKRLLDPVTRRLMGWSLIDALARLQEREDGMRGPDDGEQRRSNKTDDTR